MSPSKQLANAERVADEAIQTIHDMAAKLRALSGADFNHVLAASERTAERLRAELEAQP